MHNFNYFSKLLLYGKKNYSISKKTLVKMTFLVFFLFRTTLMERLVKHLYNIMSVMRYSDSVTFNLPYMTSQIDIAFTICNTYLV